MITRFGRILAIWLLSATVAMGQTEKPLAVKRVEALDLIASDAILSVAIRNVGELRKRGDQFIDRTELKTPVRLSDGFNFVVAYLGISRGLDWDGSAALMLMHRDFKEDQLVLAAPVADWKAMASNFKLVPADLVEGKVIDRHREEEERVVNSMVRYVAAKGNHLYLGGSEKSVSLALLGKPVLEWLPADDREALRRDDILVLANLTGEEDGKRRIAADLETEFSQLPPDDRRAIVEVLSAAEELRYAACGLRLEDGVGATVSLGFAGKKSAEILARLQGKPGAGVLTSFPEGRVIAGFAATGRGERTLHLARALLQYSLTRFVIETDELVSVAHRPNVVGVFGELWQRLEGSQAALYENENAERDGLFSLVSILETDDAPRFITDMSGLARFVSAADFAIDDGVEKIDEATILSLIKELGDDDYRTRQLATTKLGLLGAKALAALEKATKSTDPEVQFRAEAVRRQINTSLQQERGDLLKRDLLSRIRPQFAYFPKAETRSERPTDIVKMRLQLDEAPHAAQLRRLFGPDWNKLRLASVGNRVFVLLGSNTSLLDQSLKLASLPQKELPVDPRLAPFQARSARERTVEFHLSLARSQELVLPDGDTKPLKGPAELTSVGLAVAPQRIRLDLFAPYSEAKVIVKKMGW